MILYTGRTHDATFLIEGEQISQATSYAGANESPRFMLNPFGATRISVPRYRTAVRCIVAVAANQRCRFDCTSLFEAV